MLLKKLIVTCIGLLGAVMAFATININTASVEQLQQVHGIGPVKAQNIVKYRKEHGNFKSINDLTQVHGIGKKLLAKVKNELSISGINSKPVNKQTRVSTKTHEKTNTQPTPSKKTKERRKHKNKK